MHAKPDLRAEFEPNDHFSGSVISVVIRLRIRPVGETKLVRFLAFTITTCALLVGCAAKSNRFADAVANDGADALSIERCDVSIDHIDIPEEEFRFRATALITHINENIHEFVDYIDESGTFELRFTRAADTILGVNLPMPRSGNGIDGIGKLKDLTDILSETDWGLSGLTEESSITLTFHVLVVQNHNQNVE